VLNPELLSVNLMALVRGDRASTQGISITCESDAAHSRGDRHVLRGFGMVRRGFLATGMAAGIATATANLGRS